MYYIETLEKIDIADIKGDLDLILKGNIKYETTTPNYGGLRYWLTCSSCTRKVRILYRVDNCFVCRTCTKLPYQVQTVNSRSSISYLLRLEKLGRKLEQDTQKKVHPLYRGKFTRRVERILKTQKQIQMYYNSYSQPIAHE